MYECLPPSVFRPRTPRTFVLFPGTGHWGMKEYVILAKPFEDDPAVGGYEGAGPSRDPRLSLLTRESVSVVSNPDREYLGRSDMLYRLFVGGDIGRCI
jgi:hypothetical protein